MAKEIITQLSCFHRKSFECYKWPGKYMEVLGSASAVAMTEWERQDMCGDACNVNLLNCVFCAWRFSSSWMEGSLVSFASEDRWQSRGHLMVLWNSKQPIYSWLRLSCDGNVTSWQRMEITDDWWYSKGASAWFLPPYTILRFDIRLLCLRPLIAGCIKRCLTSVWRLSVAYVENTKIGTEVATWLGHHFQRQKVKGQGHRGRRHILCRPPAQLVLHNRSLGQTTAGKSYRCKLYVYVCILYMLA